MGFNFVVPAKLRFENKNPQNEFENKFSFVLGIFIYS
mgnify:CR=1 FL=1